ncbi:hypothetical protein C9374_014490 [Naegleria lovaniensis]|uniref:Dolichyl-diphosphooligosaccharide--protein glycosyltransferase subunit 1 n=1 Tax=Naegleria lovaniensis TaxID=51637 RepID=A0AA88GUG2_NAELO|nr:uncharacterized protein C9374_014490 [Naegleria lovaniensis]KAG2389090.1 hypothetical protein C9374_014490 [Naegleria lovaniensis]
MVREEVKCSIQNVGSSETKYFYLAFPKTLSMNNVAYVSARQQSNTLNVLKHKFDDELNKDASFFEIELASPLGANQKADLVISIVYVGVVRPYPKEITQTEHQKVVYESNAYFFSPYKVRHQVTTVKVGTSSIDSYSTKVKPVENKGTGIQYGPYRDVTPFSVDEMRVHYTNDRPFFIVESVDRTVEISHWGNLAIEEHYEIKHGGAKLIGPFSRYEYAKNPPQTSPSSFRKITATLPLTATDIYFRDRIGNISSSDIRVVGKNLEVDFYPRFPLFGGWRIRFYIGYNLPISDYLTTALNNPEKHKLRYKFSVPFDAPVEDLTLRVIVPEGSSDIEFRTSFPIDSEHRENLKTYLDVGGRTVVVIKKKNVVPEHNENFLLSYTFPATAVYFEPLLVIGSLFGFCMFVIIYVRLDFSIQKSEEELEKERETMSYELVETYIEKFFERDSWFTDLEQSLDRNNIENVEKKRLAMADNIKNEIIAELSKLQSKTVSTISEIEKKDQKKFEYLKDIVNAKSEKEKDETHNKYSVVSEEIYSLVDLLRE